MQLAADTTGRATADRDVTRLVAPLATTLAVAAVLEVVILRLTTRTAIHVPGIEKFAAPYKLVSGTGRLAYSAAVLLAAATLVVLVASLWHDRGRARVAAVAAAAYLVVAAAAAAGIFPSPLPTTFVLLACVLASAPAAIGDRPPGAAVALWAGVAAFVLGGTFALGEAVNTAGLGDSHMSWVLWPTEVLAVTAAALTPLLVPAGERRRGALWVAVPAGAVATAAFWTARSTTDILALWNFGLAGYLPAPVYGIAAASLAFTLTCLFRSGRRRDAIALVLLVVGGMGLTSTYQGALVICGLCLFATAPATTGGEAVSRTT